VRNLVAEGITTGVHAVGDVMYDTTLAAVERAEQSSKILETLELAPRSYAVSTIHRAENTDNPDRLAQILAWLEDAARQFPVILPLHPRTRNMIGLAYLSGVRVIKPLGYLDMTHLVHHAAAVFTDSGGLQKEAYFHRVPCVTLRDETEWIETVEAGWNRLWKNPHYQPRRVIRDYGEGNSAQAIAEVIRQMA
jgi:UDP-GlcNAc3NAcA epimerase